MSIIRRPRSLFGRTAAILALTLAVFTLSVVAVSGWFVVFPVGKRSADDFAALMVLAARTRVELPPEAEADFRQELLQQHSLQLGDEHQPLPVEPALHPYLHFFEVALQRRTGQVVEVMRGDDGTMWVDVPVSSG
jgi:two-component system osmolarity sensor histidine kinase EnvZ